MFNVYNPKNIVNNFLSDLQLIESTVKNIRKKNMEKSIL